LSKKYSLPLLSGINKTKLYGLRIYKAMDCLYQRLDKVLDNFWKQNKGKTTLLLYKVIRRTQKKLVEGRCERFYDFTCKYAIGRRGE
jgi:hypothetical protein